MKKRLALLLAVVLLLNGFSVISFAEGAKKGIGEKSSVEEELKNELEVGDTKGLEEAVRAPASNFETLKNDVKNGDEIEVSGDYSFTEPVVIENKSVTIKNKGATTFKRADDYHDRFFEIKDGGKLTLLSDDGAFVFDGEGDVPEKGYRPRSTSRIPGRSNYKMNGAFIDVANGELIIGKESAGPRFVDDKNIANGMYVAALGASGPKGNIVFNGGEISGMRYGSYDAAYSSYSAGAFTVGDHATLVLNDGLFTNNHTQVENFDDSKYFNNKSVRDSLEPFDYKTMMYEGSAGVARLDVGAKMVMNGGLMEKNISDAGAIWVGAYEPNIGTIDDNKIDTWQEKANAKFTMNGGTIDDNWGITNKSAGGIIGMFHADVVINGGTISNNKGEVGGILVWDHYRYNGRRALRSKGYSDWIKKFKVSLRINGGNFIGNEALRFGDYLNFIHGDSTFSQGQGGAIYIGTKDAKIGTGGKDKVLIKDNYAQDEGGGIFVSTDPYKLIMGSALITENEAKKSYGGLYQGDSSYFATIYPQHGATITKNTIGEDSFSHGKDVGKSFEAHLQILPNYTKLGSKIDCYTYDFRPIADRKLMPSNKPAIFEKGDTAHTETVVRDEIALSLEDVYSDVVIKNNKSYNAGGMAVYGYLTIGSYSKQGNLETLSATSEIDWAGLKEDVKSQTLKDEDINISLYRKLDDVEYLVDDLIVGNKTTYITMLPKNIYGTDVRENTYLKGNELEALGFKLEADLYQRDEQDPIKYTYEYNNKRYAIRAENYKFKITILPPDFAPESWYENEGPTVDGKTYHKLTVDSNGGTLVKGENAYWVAEDFGFTINDLPVEIQKDGKSPAGYSYEKGGALIGNDETIRLSDDQTIYAVWEREKPNIVPGSESDENPDVDMYHKLTLDPNGGALFGERFYWVKDGYGVTLDDLKGTQIEREEHHFSGWLRDGKKVNFPLVVTDELVLKADWEKAKADLPDSGGIILEPIEKPGENREKVFVEGYIQGYPGRTVRAEEKITRSEAAAMLARAYQLDLGDKTRADFLDTSDSWYNEYINAVVKKGIMEGYPDGNFRPHREITRAEFVKMIETLDRENEAVAPFGDIQDHWAEDFINRAYGNGRIDGYPDGTFRPNDSITRAEAVKTINAMIGRKADSASDLAGWVNYIDLEENNWAYLEILLASDHWIWK